MAYQMDALGNIIGEYESEEERRKRQEAEASAIAHKQETITYADGSQTRKSTQEIPASATYTIPNPAQYNASIAQQESGANPNIGFHDRNKSSAYGTYGLTQGAYQDARKLNPALPQDITQATPEQQTAAQNAFTQQNAKYLQAYGIEPTQQNLQAAHFLGAKGLANYLQSGAISPQAAAANGGEENVRRIVNARLGGQPAPASGAVQQPAVPPQEPVAQSTTPVNPMYALGQGGSGLGVRALTTGPVPEQGHPSKPYIDAFQANQDNVGELWKIRNDPNAPVWLQERAGNQAYDLINKQVKAKEAETQLKQILPGLLTGDQGSTRDFMKTMADTGGNYLKYLFLHLLNPDLGKQYAIENLGVGSKWDTVTLEDGRNVEVKFNGAGRPIEGYDMDQKPLSKADLLAASTGVLPKGVHVTKTETYIDPATRQVVTHQTLSNSKERFTMGGKTLPADFDKTRLVPEQSFTAAENKRVEKVVGDLNNKYPGGPTEAQKLGAMIAAGIPNVRIEQEMGLKPGSLGSATERNRISGGAQVPGAQSQVGAQVQQVPGGVSQANTFNTGNAEFRAPMPGESKESYAAAKKNFETVAAKDIKEATDFAKSAVDVRNRLEDVKQAVSAVRTGKHYFGPMFGSSPQGGLASAGALPGVQEFVGGKFGDQTSMNNTTLMRSLMTREGLNGIKNSMGPSISNFDVQSWLKSNSVTENSSPEQLLQYFTRLHNQLYDIAQKDKENAVKYGQLAPSFNFGERLPDFRTNTQGEKKSKNQVDRDNPLLK